MDHNHSDQHSGEHSHHVVPLGIYFKSIVALLILTVVTVGASYIDFGKANIFVAMGIASLKASIVMLFFMGLKYDNWVNRLTILLSFVALFLFIFFSASDLWTRARPSPITVKAAVVFSEDDLKKLEASTAELVAKGKELFDVNCVSCHGAGGKGDGVAAAGLNPPPRNFHAGASTWKNGTSGKAIYVTLSYGIAGSGMASYKQLNPGERWALAHYLHTMTPEVQPTSSGDARYADALKEDGVGAGGPAKGPSLPLDFAAERLLKSK